MRQKHKMITSKPRTQIAMSFIPAIKSSFFLKMTFSPVRDCLCDNNLSFFGARYIGFREVNANHKKDSSHFSFFYNDVIFLNDAKIYFNDIRSYDLVQFYSKNARDTQEIEGTESVFCSFCTRPR